MVERAHGDGDARDFFCYIDDFPTFVIGNLHEIFTAARQYPLNFVLSHQCLSEMDEALRKTILGTVGTVMAFRLGKDEAAAAAGEFPPHCTEDDLLNLEQHHFFIRMEMAGKNMAFTGRVMGLPEKPRVREEDVRAAAYANFPRPPSAPPTQVPLPQPKEQQGTTPAPKKVLQKKALIRRTKEPARKPDPTERVEDRSASSFRQSSGRTEW
jgi:hypothetical protein